MTYYVIKENSSEYGPSKIVYIAQTLKEAESKVMNYANWYCPQGTCEIHKVNSNMEKLEVRTYHGGKLTAIKTY